MPAFTYKAVGRDGKAQQGVIEAEALDLATRQLRARGLTPLKIVEGDGEADAKPPTRQEVLSMTAELSVLLRAGLPLDRALKVLIDMDGQPRMRAVLADLLLSLIHI